MKQVRFEIAKSPVPASRPRVTPRGTYYPKAHEDYKEYLKTELLKKPELVTMGPVSLELVFVMPPYKTSDYPTSRCDVDNLSKILMDAMSPDRKTKVQRYWADDSLIVDLRALKRFVRPGEEPHTKVRLSVVDGNISDHVDLMMTQ